MGQRKSEIIKNHMEVYWHDYASASKGIPITEAGLVEKSSVIGRTGLMLLECGTGAWRVRSSMNTLSRELGVTTTADIGLLSIEFTCFDGDQCYTQSLCLTNTGVNTSRLNRLEHFVNDFEREGKFMTGEELHSHLDEIERIHGLYSPIALGFAAALACGCFTFLLGGGIVEMLCAFCGAGIGNFVRCKLTKHHFTLFLGITASVCSASLVYAILLKLAEVLFAVSVQHEAGYICSIESSRFLQTPMVMYRTRIPLPDICVSCISNADYLRITTCIPCGISTQRICCRKAPANRWRHPCWVMRIRHSWSALTATRRTWRSVRRQT